MKFDSISSAIKEIKKRGMVVVLDNEDESLAKDICMHIAAMKPLAIDETGISQVVLDKEKEIFKSQAK